MAQALPVIRKVGRLAEVQSSVNSSPLGVVKKGAMPSTMMKSDDEPLTKPTPMSIRKVPRPGAIWRFNSNGDVCNNGKYRALVVDNLVTVKTFSDEFTASLAIDFTETPRYPLHRMHQMGEFDAKDRQIMIDNVKANKGKGRPLDELLDGKTETRKIAIIAATGPSFKESASLCANIDRSKVAIISLNSAALALPHIDYEFVLDRRVKNEWAEAAVAKGATLVAHPDIPSAFADIFGKDKTYFYGHPGTHPLNAGIRAAYADYMYGVTELEMASNVGPTALHFAYLMGFEHILYIGLDVIYSDSVGMHWKPNVNDVDGKMPYLQSCRALTIGVLDADGKRSEKQYRVNIEYLRAYHMTQGYAYWMLQKGIHVYNASGQGPIWQWPQAHANYALENRPDVTGKIAELTPLETTEFVTALKALEAYND